MSMIPFDSHTLAVFLAAICALAGLILWSAGIRVARMLLALAFGGAMAGFALWVLPLTIGLGELPAACIGLAGGALIGALIFRLAQALVLAVCLGIAAGGAYHYVQMQGADGAPRAAVSVRSFTAAHLAATAQDAMSQRHVAPGHLARGAATSALAQWQAMPAIHRQHLLALGFSVAIVTLVVAWLIPRHITWVLTAVTGSALLIGGGFVLLGTYAPDCQQWMPQALMTRLGTLAAIVLAGMAVQRLAFWPRAAGRSGILATA